MPRNSLGTYTLPAGNPVTSGTPITASWANTTLSDIATALTGSLARDGSGSMTASLKGYSGTAAAPSFTFSAEATLGMFRPTAGAIGFSSGSTEVFRISGAGAFTADGTDAAPSLSFLSDTDTGFYRVGANSFGISAGGTNVGTWSTTGLELTTLAFRTAGRLFANFSSSTLTDRLLFSSGVSNGATGIIAAPNGTSQVAAWAVVNNTTPTNAGYGAIAIDGSYVYVDTSATGSGTTLPMAFRVGSTVYGIMTTAGRWLFGNGTADDGASTIRAGSHIRSDGMFVSGVTSSTAWNVDMTKNSGTGYTAVTASGTYDLASGSGLVMVHSDSTGDMALFLCYAGLVTKVAGAASIVAGAPGVSEIGVTYNAGTATYRITNGYATTQNLFISGIRTRFAS